MLTLFRHKLTKLIKYNEYITYKQYLKWKLLLAKKVIINECSLLLLNNEKSNPQYPLLIAKNK